MFIRMSTCKELSNFEIILNLFENDLDWLIFTNAIKKNLNKARSF